MEIASPLPLLLAPLRPQIAQVERLLQESLAEVEAPLGPALRQQVASGKRLRPALVILCGQALAGAEAPLLRLAAGLDMLHAATLVHDDLLDGSGLRHGRRTLHTLWPVGAVVLAGDLLLAQAVSLVAGLGQAEVLRLFGALLGTLCTGEMREALGERGRPRGREDYFHSIEAKTASFFATAAEMAGLLAGGAAPQVAALRGYGRELGLAYQIVDDVLDLTGDEAELGKPPAGDLRQGLITLPILCHLERAGADDPVRALLANPGDEVRLRAAVEAVRASGAVEAALGEARAHLQRAQGALAALPDRPARRQLAALAAYVVERRH